MGKKDLPVLRRHRIASPDALKRLKRVVPHRDDFETPGGKIFRPVRHDPAEPIDLLGDEAVLRFLPQGPFARGEMVVDGLLADPQILRQIVHPDAGETASSEEILRRFDNPLMNTDTHELSSFYTIEVYLVSIGA